ncbi:TIGR01440 family protein [Ferroacidibacillus organovorans]|uniref:UPF0340 protein ATW55_14165 n=1 Tax=Ferroacidibacillus organovorans TaxID=1765683 RepID=A0A101XPM6_9BACL|nr:TIGR01440 family protein [Ferroacidibacillus organovorans]KUO95273.1 hypothetical protein ATW55_14165 [Ferroacidibacillus organovorans]
MSDSFYDVTCRALRELSEHADLAPGKLLVIGASSSEVGGHTIGTAGSDEIAAQLVDAFLQVQSELGFDLAVQCCEHLNRALVVERKTLVAERLEEVSAVPVRHAGGAVAAEMYRRLHDAVLVEAVRAHAGMDIGDTFIGMHLRAVAVPIRLSIKDIGYAHVTAARTRPRLIGGARAVYT